MAVSTYGAEQALPLTGTGIGNDDVMGRQPMRRFNLVMEELRTTSRSRVFKTTSCSSRRRVISLWYLQQEVNEPVMLWSEAIVDELGLMIGPARLLPTTPQRCTFDRRREDLSGRTARLTSQ